MAKWIDLGKTSDFPEGSPVCTTAGQRALVVMQVNGEFHAIANVCPHAGKPIGDGELRGRVITCPYHGFAYDVTNGRNVDFPYDEPPVKKFPVRIVDDGVQVQMEA